LVTITARASPITLAFGTITANVSRIGSAFGTETARLSPIASTFRTIAASVGPSTALPAKLITAATITAGGAAPIARAVALFVAPRPTAPRLL
jgi:phage-related protein